MPNINGLAEAALFVQNISRARDFYEHVVGLEKLQDSEAGCVFAVAKEQLLLLVSPEKAKVPSKTPGGDVPACVGRPGEILGAGHVAFAVAENEIDGWRNRLKSKGVEVLSEVTWERGARSLYFRDPDGHLLEIATPGVWGFDSCSGAVPTLRVARPTDHFDEVVRFYTEGVGLTQLGAFEDHDGFDGVMLGSVPIHRTQPRTTFRCRASSASA